MFYLLYLAQHTFLMLYYLYYLCFTYVLLMNFSYRPDFLWFTYEFGGVCVLSSYLCKKTITYSTYVLLIVIIQMYLNTYTTYFTYFTYNYKNHNIYYLYLFTHFL